MLLDEPMLRGLVLAGEPGDMAEREPGALNVHVRKAYKSKGDDVTLSRFIKIPHEHKPARRQPMIPGLAKPWAEAGRSIFFRKGVKPVAELKNVLVSGHSNVKIGRDVRKGKLRGYWIYTLSLEERATCPRSCGHYQDCYGNSMPWAKRVVHGPELLVRLTTEIARLVGTRGRRGILVRLHALGDFYSVDYVEFWRSMLALHPRLSIYGYTAREQVSAIGIAISHIRMDYGERFMVRFSDGGFRRNCTVSIATAESCPPDAVICPEQTGKTRCCGTCALCWSTDKNIAFLEH